MLYLLDYGAGNVRSLANSIRKLGYDFEWVRHPDDLKKASKLLFPGVGAFGQALTSLRTQGYAEPLKEYIASGRPYMGICIGMQALFESSSEAPGIQGLAVLPGRVERFDSEKKTVPHMGWNRARPVRKSAEAYGLPVSGGGGEAEEEHAESRRHFYFVHSYRVAFDPQLHSSCALSTTQYGNEVYLSAVQQGNVFATQFHPEKSGRAGLDVLRAWLELPGGPSERAAAAAAQPDDWLLSPTQAAIPRKKDGLTKRIVACLDVRSNDAGDLVVTKGESYDVREKATTSGASSSSGGDVRNLGKPVDLALRYYLSGADEVTFLNITSFRSSALRDQPMLRMTELAAASIFVPLTIGGGIKDTVDPDGTGRSAKEVAEAYFRAGADKVSIGSEAVSAVEGLLASLPEGEYDPAKAPKTALTGGTGIEQISRNYGAQAVVVSIDPRRVYLSEGEEVPAAHAWSLVSSAEGQRWWYACTTKGGRETRDVDVVQLARGVELLGAGELLVNSIDADGQGKGFDRDLIELVRRYTSVPVIASSGAGKAAHFEEIFSPAPRREGWKQGSVEAALAAGIFHRGEVAIDEVKEACEGAGLVVRREHDLEKKGTTGVVLEEKGDAVKPGERDAVLA
ncbi:putative HIS7-glutamine amidotransferase/cyclase [Jaminaea rosea]|uniref:Putative HIS7-glutamine amidotransferase/cyclase n=1 Tax=Jaminaea rosea TaxID=1569628 RepID=A0A316ULJ8_9BASI|nr:putative HIS7-glutamine amidotransferase/cyclase [Jaminaea rosea]PWN25678.1 putative HIS7-glutamine amidotransferase/cyclase [Jaminaea rosea]